MPAPGQFSFLCPAFSREAFCNSDLYLRANPARSSANPARIERVREEGVLAFGHLGSRIQRLPRFKRESSSNSLTGRLLSSTTGEVNLKLSRSDAWKLRQDGFACLGPCPNVAGRERTKCRGRVLLIRYDRNANCVVNTVPAGYYSKRRSRDLLQGASNTSDEIPAAIDDDQGWNKTINFFKALDTNGNCKISSKEFMAWFVAEDPLDCNAGNADASVEDQGLTVFNTLAGVKGHISPHQIDKDLADWKCKKSN
eukprot:gene11866-14972_t